jgi:tetrachlorobenzoquinone reductase
MSLPPFLNARVVATRYEAIDIISFVLAPLPGTELPEASPGAHIDIRLSEALNRSYSLSDLKDDAGCYRLTVLKDAKSRGGSAYMHEKIRTGQILEISAPRNNFPLDEQAEQSVFIAGGIGITPFISMMKRLNAVGKPWTLHYCVRNRERAALVAQINALSEEGRGTVLYNFDEEPGGAMLDLKRVIAELPAGAHVYCCGPLGMLHAYQAAAAGLAPERVHFEFFSSDVEAAASGGYTVVLARSKREILVQQGQTILQALRNAGVDAQSSCEEGVCGACETRVLAGMPDHRDSILGPRERATNKTMMICCSGSKSERLELDL